MKIFKTTQIKELDAYTITHEPISSYNLMNRAVRCLVDELLHYLDREQHVVILAGPGNNGGDALVLARTLTYFNQPQTIYLFDNGKVSDDCQHAKRDAEKCGLSIVHNCEPEEINIPENAVVIDGLFGAGLSRPLEGKYLSIVKHINASSALVYAIDIPSGLFGEDNRNNNTDGIIKANHTFTFQQPKLSFFFADTAKFAGEVHCLDIGLHPEAISNTITEYELTDAHNIHLMPREKFSHKGTYGHGLLIAGKYGMAGAAVLSTRSALRIGIGLITTHIPSLLYEILQLSVPEAIVDLDTDSEVFTGVKSFSNYSAIGIGPGLGVSIKTYNGFKQLLEGKPTAPMVVDADALNLIARHCDLLELLPAKTIITPHPKEFDRLAGNSQNAFERFEKSRELAARYNIIVVLKGAHTSIAFPNGKVNINSTGNPGMATAGSGDVLTGIILSLLAQNYTPEEAAIIGVYLHGLAGDKAAQIKTEEALIASDIIKFLPEAIKASK